MVPTVSTISLMTPSALIAEPVLSDALFLMATVSALGFQVTTTDTFHGAVERLRVPPTLLIADIRLGEYNGLHVVLRGKAASTDLAAIVTSAADDPVLRLDAEQLGATFVVKPVSGAELRAAICRTWLRNPESTDGPIRSPFERRHVERRQGVAPASVDRRVAERRRDIHQLMQSATPIS